MENDLGSRIATCSSAFGVTGNNGAATYLLFAAHCASGTWRTAQVRWPDGSEVQTTFGDTIAAGRAPQHDGALILTPSGAGNAVYWGAPINPPNNDLGSNTGIAVSGAQSNTVGAYVCSSGAYSGTICNIRIELANVAWSFDQPINGVQHMTRMSLGVKVNTSDGIYAANGNGDSGGPIVSVVSGRARAHGVISGMYLGGSWDAPCHGFTPQGRRCSRSVWFGDITSIVNAMGVRLNTG